MHRKKFSVKIKFLLECSFFWTFMIVHLFEQSDIDIDKIIYDLKMLKVSILVEDSGIEPLTSWMQIRRSPSWANPPLILVGRGRLERPTSPLSGVRSNHLSYRPLKSFHRATLKKRNEDGHIKLIFFDQMKFLVILRKEVIQPQVPLRLPCYDFTPVADRTVVKGLTLCLKV